MRFWELWNLVKFFEYEDYFSDKLIIFWFECSLSNFLYVCFIFDWGKIRVVKKGLFFLSVDKLSIRCICRFVFIYIGFFKYIYLIFLSLNDRLE